VRKTDGLSAQINPKNPKGRGTTSVDFRAPTLPAWSNGKLAVSTNALTPIHQKADQYENAGSADCATSIGDAVEEGKKKGSHRRRDHGEHQPAKNLHQTVSVTPQYRRPIRVQQQGSTTYL
jgi:hypothetical protein